MSKVISLHGDPLPDDPQPVPEVILALEDLLQEAIAGRLVGIACASMDNAGKGGYVISGYNNYGLIAAAGIIHVSLSAQMIEDGEK